MTLRTNNTLGLDRFRFQEPGTGEVCLTVGKIAQSALSEGIRSVEWITLYNKRIRFRPCIQIQITLDHPQRHVIPETVPTQNA